MGVKPAMAASAVILGTWGSMLSPGLDHQSVISQIANVEVIDVIKVHAKTDIIAMLIAATYLTILAKILKEDKGYQIENIAIIEVFSPKADCQGAAVSNRFRNDE